MKKNLAKNAEQIAKHGRYGDDRLLHVSQAELDGLASLLPGGKLPHNPETGLPEAFFFLPFLASLGAAAAPAAAGLGAAAASAVPAALAAAAPTAASALGAAGAAGATGLMAAAAPTAATIGAAAPAAAGLTAATAAPAAATGLGSLGAAGAALPTATTLGTAGFGSTVPAIAAPTAATGLVAPSTAATGLGSLAPAGSGISAGLGAGASGTANLATGATTAAAPAATTAAPAAASTAPGIASSLPAMGAGIGAEAGAATTAAMAQPSGIGSLMGGMDMNKLLQYGAMAAMMMPSGGSDKGDDDEGKDVGAKEYTPGDTATPPAGGATGGLDAEFDFFPGSRYYAEGGIASLGGGDQGMDDETLIDATVAAIQGQTPNADAIVQMFIQRFGPDALQDLLRQVQATQSNSDGMSDSVPAMINGQGQTAPAQISEGEYIVPADAVSGLGNGSTMAGARQLDDMVKRTRDMRGMPQSPKSINPLKAMPV